MSATTFLVMIACLLLAAKAAGWLCQRAGIPAVLGQLLIGVLLGPSLLHWVHADPTLNDFANIGVILLMFIAE
jgi:Kef-type K+ transport system membrane component KefB